MIPPPDILLPWAYRIRSGVPLSADEERRFKADCKLMQDARDFYYFTLRLYLVLALILGLLGICLVCVAIFK